MRFDYPTWSRCAGLCVESTMVSEDSFVGSMEPYAYLVSDLFVSWYSVVDRVGCADDVVSSEDLNPRCVTEYSGVYSASHWDSCDVLCTVWVRSIDSGARVASVDLITVGVLAGLCVC